MLGGADARSRTQLCVATSFGVTRDVAGELAPHALDLGEGPRDSQMHHAPARGPDALQSCATDDVVRDRKSTRLNSSHQIISYAVFCLKKKKNKANQTV